jgi:hypothetical protein
VHQPIEINLHELDEENMWKPSAKALGLPCIEEEFAKSDGQDVAINVAAVKSERQVLHHNNLQGYWSFPVVFASTHS